MNMKLCVLFAVVIAPIIAHPISNDDTSWEESTEEALISPKAGMSRSEASIIGAQANALAAAVASSHLGAAHKQKNVESPAPVARLDPI
jgi:hypothetical protein